MISLTQLWKNGGIHIRFTPPSDTLILLEMKTNQPREMSGGDGKGQEEDVPGGLPPATSPLLTLRRLR